MELSAVRISVHSTPEGAIQVSIGDGDTGYRISGPKFDGRSTLVYEHVVTKSDAKLIAQYIDEVT